LKVLKLWEPNYIAVCVKLFNIEECHIQFYVSPGSIGGLNVAYYCTNSHYFFVCWLRSIMIALQDVFYFLLAASLV